MRTVAALTIAGSDPSGGAGIQADLKTFHQHHVYGMAALTLLTVQNTCTVTRVEPVEPALVRQQIEAILTDIPPQAIKTGALGTAATIEAIAALHFSAPLVVDPVMVSKHGHALMAPDAQAVFRAQLLPKATLLTPNTLEAAALVGRAVETVEQAAWAAEALTQMGAKAVLVKGGHLSGAHAVDVLFSEGRVITISAPRIETRDTHGTGCTLSAAIAARLAHGQSLEDAVRSAKAWLTQAIASAPGLGHGQGPVNHLQTL